MGFFTTEKSQKLAQEFAVERGLIGLINSCTARDEYVHVIADKAAKQIRGEYFMKSYFPNHLSTGSGKINLGEWSKQDDPSRAKLRKHLAEHLGEFAWYASEEGKAANAEIDKFFDEMLARECELTESDEEIDEEIKELEIDEQNILNLINKINNFE